MMPFLDNRLISTVRCPDGLDGEHFFMKHLNTKSKNIGIKNFRIQFLDESFDEVKNIINNINH